MSEVSDGQGGSGDRISGPHGDTLVVTGELDGSLTDELREALASPEVRRVDMSGVTFLDSSGIRALVHALHDRGDDRPFTIAAPSRAVRRVLEIVGLTTLFDADDAGSGDARRPAAAEPGPS